jgi:hypothetical protein
MRTEATVDLLRKTLICHGHTLPHSFSLKDGAIFRFNHGEYLVSLLSHDESLLDDLHSMAMGTFDNKYPIVYRAGPKGEGFLLLGDYGDDFNNYVDVVKFMWLTTGVQNTLWFIQNLGLRGWSHVPRSHRDLKLENLVLTAQKDLRRQGVQFSEMAEFFSDGVAAKAIISRL